MSNENVTEKFDLRGDHKSIRVIEITAPTVNEAFDKARKYAHTITGVTSIKYKLGSYSI